MAVQSKARARLRPSVQERLAAELQLDILTRALPPGSALPSVRALARSRGVSAFTAAAVFDLLVAAGVAEARRGSGYFVAGVAPARRIARLREFRADSVWERRHEAEPGLIRADAGCGWLPAAWLHTEAVRAALRAQARSPLLGLSYGNPYGLVALRTQFATLLRARGVQVQEEQVLTTQGATQALHLVIQELIQRGDRVIVEDPCYPPLLGLLRGRGVRLEAIARTAVGPDLAQLRKLLRRQRPGYLFTNTTLHNPTGTSTSLPVAHQLLELAERHDFTIIEDDLFSELAPRPEASLAALDQCRRVIMISSISKTIAPDLRVGYLAATPAIIARLARAKTAMALASSELAEEIVLHVLTRGHYRRHLESLRRRLGAAQQQVQELFEARGVSLAYRPAAGMFLWARLPSTDSVSKLWRAASALGVLLAPGELFRPDGRATPYWRFNVAHCAAPELLDFVDGLRHSA
jgi:DNA-binding transcriptional MocR family regulator